MNRKYCRIMLATILFYSVGVNAQSFTDLKFSLFNNDNLSYGFYDRDIKGDSVASTTLKYGVPVPAGEYGTLTYLFSGQFDIYSKYNDLNAAKAEVGLYYKSKLGIGATVPWYQLGATVGYRSVADDLRDATVLGASLSIGKTFSDRFSGNFNYSFTTTDAADKTFDGTLHGLSLAADYLLTADWLLFGSFANYSGDIVATTVPYTQIINQSSSITRDDVYGTGVARFAYRLDASTNVAELGLNYYLNEQSSLELVYRQRDSDVGYWTDYTSHIIAVNYLYRF